MLVGSGMADFGRGGRVDPVTTRFGAPAAAVREVIIGDCSVLVLPRHGDDHGLPPHRINYRANLLALKQCGATAVISVNTVGVITEAAKPGELAVPAQLIDYSWGRDGSYFEGGEDGVRHIDFSVPFSDALRQRLLRAAAVSGVPCHDGGVYGVTQGPRLETAAEVDRYEKDGVDYVGMTLMPEAALARELELESACLSMVVNPAAGRGDADIHADIRRSLESAKSRAVRVLEAFFAL